MPMVSVNLILVPNLYNSVKMRRICVDVHQLHLMFHPRCLSDWVSSSSSFFTEMGLLVAELPSEEICLVSKNLPTLPIARINSSCFCCCSCNDGVEDGRTIALKQARNLSATLIVSIMENTKYLRRFQTFNDHSFLR